MFANLFSKLIGIITTYVLQFIYSKLDDVVAYIVSFFKNKKREEAAQKAKEEYEKVVKDPTSTPEQRGSAYAKYLNAGRD